jgi:ubiquinone/menaquinone biosynthesis C-methylase UbiE
MRRFKGSGSNPRGDDVNLRAAPQMFEYRAIVERIARDQPSRVLDWGCGWGQITDLLVGAGLNVESFDYRGQDAPNALVAFERYPQLRAYASSDPVTLPYNDGAFDAVLSCGVLEHVSDPDGSLEEIGRVLRAGGTLYCFKLPNRFSYLERIAKSVGLYYHGQAPADRLYTERSARELLERHRYEVLELRRANMLPLTLTSGWAHRAARGIWSVNRALARIPVLNFVATNVEVIARPR